MTLALDAADTQSYMSQLFVGVVDANADGLGGRGVNGAVVDNIREVSCVQLFTLVWLDAMQRVENGKLDQPELHGFLITHHDAAMPVDPAEPAVRVPLACERRGEISVRLEHSLQASSQASRRRR